jgi:hypothetical protein
MNWTGSTEPAKKHRPRTPFEAVVWGGSRLHTTEAASRLTYASALRSEIAAGGSYPHYGRG